MYGVVSPAMNPLTLKTENGSLWKKKKEKNLDLNGKGLPPFLRRRKKTNK